MDARAWLLKVAIVQIELKQKDPTIGLRSSPPAFFNRFIWDRCKTDLAGFYLFSGTRSNSGHRHDLAFELAVTDARALLIVMQRVEKNDNLREVFARALRSIRQGYLHAGASDAYDSSFQCFAIKRHLAELPASASRSKHEYVDASDSDSELAKFANAFHAFLTSVLHLLTFVFQYLAGYVDRGGSKTYSSGAFDFRASFVALVLFQGAYVWIKFRQAARPGCRKRKAPDVEHGGVNVETGNLKGVYARPIREKSSGAITHHKYEPRFTPPRQEGDDGTEGRSKRLPLGEYHTPVEALIVLQIARYYYDNLDRACVELEGGRYKSPIPLMSEQERGLAGEAKRTWVTSTAKRVGKQMYADFQRKMKGKHLDMATEAGAQGAEINDPSSSALTLPCSSFPVPTTMVAEPDTASAAPSSPSVPLLSSTGASSGGVYDFSDSFSDVHDMSDVLFGDSGSPNLPDQQLSVVSYQMHYQGFAQLLGDPSLPDVGAAPGWIEHVSEPVLNPSPSFQQGGVLVADADAENIDGRIFLQQSDPVLQHAVFCQKCLGDNARQFVHLDQLRASQIQILKLQQENESLKIRLQQVASLSCNVD